MLRTDFGTDGQGHKVEKITLTNQSGTRVEIGTMGAAIVSFVFKDKHGVDRDVVLGYDTGEEYFRCGTCFGQTVGRNCNRIANAQVTIDGVTYQLEANDGTNNLHSGINGYENKVWDVERMDEEANSVTLSCVSPDLEQGFPGTMTAHVTFALSEDHALSIHYEATCDKDTVANFTNHSYFNLAGHDGGYMGDQMLKVYSSAFTPVTPTGSIPTGEIRPVEGTPFDFREYKAIGKEIDADYDQLAYTGGYDHTFVLDNGGKLEVMAEAYCKETGIHMTSYTDCPGVQVYMGNYIQNGEKGKGGVIYGKRHGFCLESNFYPNAINTPSFQSSLLKAGDVYQSTTVYRLSLED